MCVCVFWGDGRGRGLTFAVSVLRPQCFTALVGWDPNAPCQPAAPAAAVNKPKPKKKKEEDLSDLLDAGLSMGKKKNKGGKK